MRQTCTTCKWRTGCELRTSGNAQRCAVWRADRMSLGDILMAAFGAAAFVFALGIVPLLIMAAKGVTP